MKYLTTNPKCEPFMKKYGLFTERIGGSKYHLESDKALFWMMNMCDGEHTVDDIVVKSGLSKEILNEAARRLLKVALLKRIGEKK